VVIAVPIAVGIAVALAIMLQPRMHSAPLSFVPQVYEEMLGVSGLAAQMGFGLSASQAVHTPVFYAELISTPRVRKELLLTKYVASDNGRMREGDYFALYNVKGKTQLAQMQSGERLLARHLRVVGDMHTGMVHVNASAQWPEVAEQMANRILELVTEFNESSRQSKAAEESRFTRDRLAETRRELQQAEDELKEFLVRNRSGLETSPPLMFEFTRRQQDVALRSQLVATLAQSYEKANIERSRDTPLITIVQAPTGFARPVPRGTIWKSLLAVVLVGSLSLVGVLLREFIATPRSDGEYPELRRVLRSARLIRRSAAAKRG
jgi:uncharacterized protein involved in exopolysaccharide biosynthesis